MVSLRVCGVAQGKAILPRAMVMQRKTHRPAQFPVRHPTVDLIRSIGRRISRHAYRLHVQQTGK